MLAAFRSFAKSPWAVGLLGLLIVSFAVFGIGDIFRGNTGSDVIKVGSRAVSQLEFAAAWSRNKKNLEQQYQRPIPVELAVEQGIDRSLLKQMAENEALTALLEKIGLRAPKSLIEEQLTEAPIFFNPVTGKFDPASFDRWLNENGMTRDIYMNIVRGELTQAQFASAAVAGMEAPRAYAALAGAITLEQRDVAFFRLTPASVGQIAPPTDAELNAFLKENASQLTKPEVRSFSIVRFSRKVVEPTVGVDPAELQKRFEFEKDSLGRPETRTVVQINVKDAAQANAVIARLNKGESAAVVAGSVGQKPIRFDDKPRSAFFDPTIADAAFKLSAGGVSAPLKGQFGLAVVKVESVNAGQVASLEANRAQLEAKVRAATADRKVAEAAKTYEDSHNAGADMAASAAKAGLTVTKIPGIAKNGAGPDGRPIVSETVATAVFEASQGVESQIIQEGDGEYFIVRVDNITPPALPSLDEVRVPLARSLMMRRLSEAQQKKADELAARVRKGESIDAVAASIGSKVERISNISQPTLREHAALGRELISGILASRKGDAFVAPGQVYSVAVVTAIRPGDLTQTAQLTNAQRGQFRQMLASDLEASGRRYAAETMKARTNQVNARLAMGVDATKAKEGLEGDKADDKAKK